MTAWRFLILFGGTTWKGALDRTHLIAFGILMGSGLLATLLGWPEHSVDWVEKWRFEFGLLVFFITVQLIRTPYVLFKREHDRADRLQGQLDDIFASPFEVVFDEKNTGNAFWWNTVVHDDDEQEGDRGTPVVLYNVRVKNRSSRTIKDVECFIDIGTSFKHELLFDRTEKPKMDLHPGAEELVNIQHYDPVQEKHLHVVMKEPEHGSIWTVTVRGQDAYEAKLRLIRNPRAEPLFKNART